MSERSARTCSCSSGWSASIFTIVASTRAVVSCPAAKRNVAMRTTSCTAGVEPIVPDSPMPFAPSGLSGLGVSVLNTSYDGSSAADGIA